MVSIVIDTNIWIGAMANDEYFDINASDAFYKFIGNNSLCLGLDYDGKILEEYRDNLRHNRKFQLELQRLMQRNRCIYFSSKLSSDIRKSLLIRGFHEQEDHIFVGVALNGDKVIVSNDSDYGANGEVDKSAVYEYMKSLGLSVYSAQRFIEEPLY